MKIGVMGETCSGHGELRNVTLLRNIKRKEKNTKEERMEQEKELSGGKHKM
jgi:hypothetical protein